jgi:hypothetical protein
MFGEQREQLLSHQQTRGGIRCVKILAGSSVPARCSRIGLSELHELAFDAGCWLTTTSGGDDATTNDDGNGHTTTLPAGVRFRRRRH